MIAFVEKMIQILNKVTPYGLVALALIVALVALIRA